MKSIIFIRHAEATPISINITDFNRPLNNQGIKDAKLIGNFIYNNNKSIDMIISSSANRAISTAKIIAKQIDFNKTIDEKKTIYNATPNQIIDIINKLNNNFQIIVLCGHNPALHILSEQLTNKKINHFSTCSIVKINFNVKYWENIKLGKLEYFFSPRILKNNT